MARQRRRTLNLSKMWIIAIAIGACLVFAPAQRSAVAADLTEQAHSLKLAPADSAFYSVSLHMKDQWNAFLDSNAYGKLLEIPVVQLGKMQLMFQWQQNPAPALAKVREYLESSEGEDAVGVLKEMFSEEVFVYGAGDVADTFKLFMELQRSTQLIHAEMSDDEGGELKKLINQSDSESDDEDSDAKEDEDSEAKEADSDAKEDESDEAAEAVDSQAEISRKFLEIFESHADELNVPTVVLGFRIKDAERAKRELDEIHSLIRNALDEHQPELAAHLERDEINGHEFLIFRLDGSMIPWDKMRVEKQKISERDLKKWQDLISKKTFTLALGVMDEFVLVSVGASTDHLKELGKGSTLVEQAAIKRLGKFSDQKVISIGYLAKAFAQNMGSVNSTIEDIANTVDASLQGAEISAEHRKKIAEDIRSLDLKRVMPEPGEASSVVLWTDRGYEGYRYAASKPPTLDSSKPLSIINHVGGSPALVIASRSNNKIEDYEAAVKWLKKLVVDIETIAEEKSEPDDWKKYQDVREKGLALLKRMDTATREHLYPALEDGQGAFVMDLSATSKKWFKDMPPGNKPLPMLELALVAGVSDAERLRQGITEYIDIVKDAIKLARELDPETPEVKFPKAQVRELDGGKMYVYPLPKEWGIDKSIAANAGLADDVAAVSLMPATTERMVSDSTPDFDTSLELDRPAAVIAHIDFVKFIDALRPWIDYGFDVAMGKIKPVKDEDDEADDKGDEDDNALAQNPIMFQLGMIAPQVHQFLDVVSAMRSATSVSYEEDGLWVTHSETHIEDLEKKSRSQKEKD